MQSPRSTSVAAGLRGNGTSTPLSIGTTTGATNPAVSSFRSSEPDLGISDPAPDYTSTESSAPILNPSSSSTMNHSTHPMQASSEVKVKIDGW